MSTENEFILIPLGGTGEIGMNLNLYGYKGKWLIVDCGITFGDKSTMGYDVLMPDPSFIIERKDEIAGMVITHAHEDHVGAVPHLWKYLECPIYTTPFTASVIKRKCKENNVEEAGPINVVPLQGSVDVGPFGLEFINLTHSIPEPNAVLITTDEGRVLHTGDWKIDPEPLVGAYMDIDRLKKIGEEGVDALVCDSTNALEEGRSGSEATVREAMIELVGNHKSGRVAVACFATNVARLETIAVAAEKNGRRVGLVGRSLWRMYEIAQENGYLENIPAFLTDKEAANLPRDKVLICCTGSQGESNAALARIANGSHPNMKFSEGDTVIFSSRKIPGNERSIGLVQNQLIKMGIEVISPRDDLIHVSGHPYRDELKEMYEWTKPRCVIPVHGEARHLVAQSKLAKSVGVPHTVVGENGSVIQITPGKAEILDNVPTGRWAVDGKVLQPITKPLMRMRERVIGNGYVFVTVALDAIGQVCGDTVLSAFGVWDNDPDEEGWWTAREMINQVLAELSQDERRDDEPVIDGIEKVLRKHLKDEFGKRSFVEVNVIRV